LAGAVAINRRRRSEDEVVAAVLGGDWRRRDADAHQHAATRQLDLQKTQGARPGWIARLGSKG